MPTHTISELLGPRFGANKADEPARTTAQKQELDTPTHTQDRNCWGRGMFGANKGDEPARTAAQAQ